MSLTRALFLAATIVAGVLHAQARSQVVKQGQVIPVSSQSMPMSVTMNSPADSSSIALLDTSSLNAKLHDQVGEFMGTHVDELILSNPRPLHHKLVSQVDNGTFLVNTTLAQAGQVEEPKLIYIGSIPELRSDGIGPTSYGPDDDLGISVSILLPATIAVSDPSLISIDSDMLVYIGNGWTRNVMLASVINYDGDTNMFNYENENFIDVHATVTLIDMDQAFKVVSSIQLQNVNENPKINLESISSILLRLGSSGKLYRGGYILTDPEGDGFPQSAQIVGGLISMTMIKGKSGDRYFTHIDYTVGFPSSIIATYTIPVKSLTIQSHDTISYDEDQAAYDEGAMNYVGDSDLNLVAGDYPPYRSCEEDHFRFFHHQINANELHLSKEFLNIIVEEQVVGSIDESSHIGLPFCFWPPKDAIDDHFGIPVLTSIYSSTNLSFEIVSRAFYINWNGNFQLASDFWLVPGSTLDHELGFYQTVSVRSFDSQSNFSEAIYVMGVLDYSLGFVMEANRKITVDLRNHIHNDPQGPQPASYVGLVNPLPWMKLKGHNLEAYPNSNARFGDTNWTVTVQVIDDNENGFNSTIYIDVVRDSIPSALRDCNHLFDFCDKFGKASLIPIFEYGPSTPNVSGDDYVGRFGYTFEDSELDCCSVSFYYRESSNINLACCYYPQDYVNAIPSVTIYSHGLTLSVYEIPTVTFYSDGPTVSVVAVFNQQYQFVPVLDYESNPGRVFTITVVYRDSTQGPEDNLNATLFDVYSLVNYWEGPVQKLPLPGLTTLFLEHVSLQIQTSMFLFDYAGGYPSFYSSGLPAGLSLDARGLLTGRPTEFGTYVARIDVIDSPTMPVNAFSPGYTPTSTLSVPMTLSIIRQVVAAFVGKVPELREDGIGPLRYGPEDDLGISLSLSVTGGPVSVTVHSHMFSFASTGTIRTAKLRYTIDYYDATSIFNYEQVSSVSVYLTVELGGGQEPQTFATHFDVEDVNENPMLGSSDCIPFLSITIFLRQSCHFYFEPGIRQTLGVGFRYKERLFDPEGDPIISALAVVEGVTISFDGTVGIADVAMIGSDVLELSRHMTEFTIQSHDDVNQELDQEAYDNGARHHPNIHRRVFVTDRPPQVLFGEQQYTPRLWNRPNADTSIKVSATETGSLPYSLTLVNFRPVDVVSDYWGFSVSLAVSLAQPHVTTEIVSVHAGTLGLVLVPGTRLDREQSSEYHIDIYAHEMHSIGFLDGLEWSYGRVHVEIQANSAPVVKNPIDKLTATVSVQLSFDLAASFDDEYGAANLTYHVDVPPWLTLVAAGGALSGTPVTEGTLSIAVTAADSGIPPLSATMAFVLVVQTNQAPMISHSGSLTLPLLDEMPLGETADTGHTFTVLDPDGDVAKLSVRLMPEEFSLHDDGRLRLAAGTSYDYEVSPSVTVSVVAVDEVGKLSTATIVLSVTDLNEPPSVVMTVALQHATLSVAFSYDLVKHFDDEDVGTTLTYTLVEPPWMTLGADSGILTGRPDSAGRQSVVAIAADGGNPPLAATLSFAVTVQANQPPSVTHTGTQTLAVLDETPIAAPAGTGYTFTYTDPDGDDALVSVTLVPTGFALASDGALQVSHSVGFDYEEAATVTVSLTFTDEAGFAMTAAAVISVTDLDDETPVLTAVTASVALAENVSHADGASASLTVTLADEDTALDMLLVTVTDSSDAVGFSLSGTGMQRVLVFDGAHTFNYEVEAAITVTVTVTDRGIPAQSATLPLTVGVGDVNDRPQRTGVLPDDTVEVRDPHVRTVTNFTDEEVILGRQSLSLGITTSPSVSWLTISGTVISGLAPGETTVTVTVEATDDGDPPLSASDVYEVRFLMNNLPVISTTGSQTVAIIDSQALAADTGSGISVTATDADGDTVSLAVGPTSQFRLADGTLVVLGEVLVDYEVATVLVATLSAHDGRDTSTQEVTLSVEARNDVPPSLSRSGTQVVLNEGDYPNVTDTGHVFTFSDGDRDSLLPSGSVSDNRFVLSGADRTSPRALQVKAGTSFDHESEASITISVTAADGVNTAATETVTLGITDINEVPTVVSLVAGQSATVSIVFSYTLSTHFDDEDEGTTLTYTISGPNWLSVDSNSGVLSGTPDVAGTQTVRATASDGASPPLAATVTFAVAVQANQPPLVSRTGDQTLDVLDETPITVPTGTGHTFAYLDPDGDDALVSVSVLPAAFQLAANGALQVSHSSGFDYEAAAAVTVSLVFTDESAFATTMRATIQVTDRDDETPVLAAATTAVGLAENVRHADGASASLTVALADEDTALGELSVTVTDSSDAVNFRLAGTGAQRALVFDEAHTFNYEIEAAITITVTVADRGTPAQSATLPLTIGIGDVNDRPQRTGVLPDDTVEVRDPHVRTVTNFTDEEVAVGRQSLALAIITSPSVSWLTISGTVISGLAPGETRVTVTVEATDDGDPPLSASDVYEVRFLANNLPVLSITGSQTVALIDSEALAADIGSGISVTATDADGDTVSLAVGPTSQFRLTDGTLVVRAGVLVDYEVATVLVATLSAHDGRDTSTQEVTLSVTPRNDVPPSLSHTGTQVVLNEGAYPNVTDTGHAFTFSDGDRDSQVPSGSVSDARFALSGADRTSPRALQVKAGTSFDHETEEHITVAVTATDGTNATARVSVTLSITDLNEAPTVRTSLADAAVQVNHGYTVDLANTFGDEDQPGDTLTLSQVSTVPGLSLDSGASMLAGAPSVVGQYYVSVAVSDGRGGAVTTSFELIVVANSLPALSLVGGRSLLVEGTFAAATDAGVGFGVADVEDDSAGLTVTLSLTGDARFALRRAGGRLVVTAGAVFDHETVSDRVFTLTLHAEDSDAGKAALVLTVSVVNRREPPWLVRALPSPTVVAHNTLGVAVPSTLFAYDIEHVGLPTYALAGAPAWLRVSGLSLAGVPAQAAVGTRPATLAVTDSVGSVASVTLTVAVLADREPVLGASRLVATVTENALVGRAPDTAPVPTGLLVSVADPDPDDAVPVLTLAGDRRFQLAGGQLRVAGGSTLDYEVVSDRVNALTLVARDGNASFLAATLVVTVSVANVAEEPVAQRVLALGEVVANNTLTLVVPAGLFSFDASHAGVGSYAFEPTHGWLSVSQAQSGQSGDDEAQVLVTGVTRRAGVAVATLAVTDSNRRSASVLVTVRVLEDHAPSLVVVPLSAVVPENRAGLSTGIEYTATDSDPDDVQPVVVVDGDGRFILSGNRLRLAAGQALDHEVAADRLVSLTLVATDGNAPTLASRVAVQVRAGNANDNRPVAAFSGRAHDFPENVTITSGTATGLTLSVSDADGPLPTAAIMHQAFDLDGQGDQERRGLRFAADYVPDHERTPRMLVTAQVSDGALVAVAVATVRFSDRNDAPVRLGPETVTTGFAPRRANHMRLLDRFRDEDGDQLVLSQSGAPGWLTLVADGVGGTPADSAIGQTRSVGVTATDPGGLAASLVLLVTVTDDDLARHLAELNRAVLYQVGKVVTEGAAQRVRERRLATTTEARVQARLVAMLRSKARELERGKLSLREFLGGQGFDVRLGQAGSGDRAPLVWGRGAYTRIKDGQGAVTWSGDIFRGELGLEYGIDGGVVGLGYSHVVGTFDYLNSFGVNDPVKGNYDIRLDTVFPYVNVAYPGFEVWALVAGGRGDITTSAPQSTAAAVLRAARVGLAVSPPGNGPWRLRLEAGRERFETRGTSSTLLSIPLEDVVVSSGNLAVGVEYVATSQDYLRTSGYLGVRRDTGRAGARGWGYEAELRLASPAARPGEVGYALGVRHVRRAGGVSEWGIDGEISRTPRLEGLGLRWGVGYRRGLEAGAGGLETALTRLESSGARPASQGWTVTPEVGYGFPLAGGLVDLHVSNTTTAAGGTYSYGFSYETGQALRLGLGWRRLDDGPHEAWVRVRHVDQP